MRVFAAQADVSRGEEMAATLAEVRQALPPLRGVVHAAGVLDDGVLLQQTWERFARVLAPKASGSWVLHTLTREAPLDFFILFSSAVSFLGHSGQGNHAAANAFEDALAHARRARGLPGTSINWGAWGEVGSVTRGGVVEDASSPKASYPLVSTTAFARWTASSARRPPRWPSSGSIGDASFPACPRAGSRGCFRKSPARHGGRGPEPATPIEVEVSFRDRLLGAPPAKRSHLLVSLVHDHAARVLGLPPSQPIDPQRPLHGLGLDSLMAVELRKRTGTGHRQAIASHVAVRLPDARVSRRATSVACSFRRTRPRT